MTVKEIGRAAADVGWREKAADAVAPRAGASRLPLSEDQVRMLLGFVFLALSVKYVVGTLQRARARS